MAVHGIIGKKVGMTQIFAADGTVTPVTVVQAGPCLVVQKKTADKDGYDALQIGFVGARPDRRANGAAKGHFEKAGVAPMRTLMEVKADKGDDLKPGDKVLCDAFAEQDHVDVIGTSKGKGFMGVVARHGFRGGAATHGSMFHRAPGSIGPSAFPSRVYPGTRSSGRLGGRQASSKNLIVVRVDAERNLLYISGAVPGARNAIVKIVRSSFGRKRA
jgi:large subunit ribosomal protein L3